MNPWYSTSVILQWLWVLVYLMWSETTKSLIWWACLFFPCVAMWFYVSPFLGLIMCDAPLGNNTSSVAHTSKINGLLPAPGCLIDRVRLVLLNKRWISLSVTKLPRPLKYHYLQGRQVNFSNIPWIQERGATSEHEPALLLLYLRKAWFFFFLLQLWYIWGHPPNITNDVIFFPCVCWPVIALS